MSFCTSRSIVALAAAVVVGCLMVAAAASARAASPASSQKALALFEATKPGSDPIGLKVRASSQKGKPPAPGERVIIKVTPKAKGYLTVFAVSSSGRILVLFPNAERTDNALKGGRTYTLFGKNSSVQLELGETASEAKMFFVMTRKPLDLSPLKPAEKSITVSISPDAKKEMSLLEERLKAAAQDTAFNSVMLSLAEGGAETLEIKTMGAPLTEKGIKPKEGKLPQSVESDTPETLTGTQGIKKSLPQE